MSQEARGNRPPNTVRVFKDDLAHVNYWMRRQFEGFVDWLFNVTQRGGTRRRNYLIAIGLIFWTGLAFLDGSLYVIAVNTWERHSTIGTVPGEYDVFLDINGLPRQAKKGKLSFGPYEVESHSQHQLKGYANFPGLNQALGRLAACLEDSDSELGIIDVGANNGDTAALIRSYTALPILCMGKGRLGRSATTVRLRRSNLSGYSECSNRIRLANPVIRTPMRFRIDSRRSAADSSSSAFRS
jgi:hypothetical protein